jgi:hypothetical protein
MQRVLIRGDGIAARCCEHLLRQAGCEVGIERSDRPRLPAIMLGGAAVAMMRDVFGRGELFDGCHPIRKRVVAWGPRAKPVTLEHAAVVVSEQGLLDAVGSGEPMNTRDADWTVITARPLPDGSAEHHFGTRMARALPVRLQCDPDTCWIESLEGGWLFLIPNSESAGWLLAVGNEADTLLAESRLISNCVAGMSGPASVFPAYPRIVEPLAGNGWLACGSAAMAFDPLCGDGTANAVREAILAAAVIRAGADSQTHYEARLTAGFQRHLSLCLTFYESGKCSAWWTPEIAALYKGLEWCGARSKTFGTYRYQLNGFDLVPVLP